MVDTSLIATPTVGTAHNSQVTEVKAWPVVVHVLLAVYQLGGASKSMNKSNIKTTS